MVKDYRTHFSAFSFELRRTGVNSATPRQSHTLRIEVNKKPEMCATVPHGVTRPSPDPSEGFSQLFTELPSSPTFSPKKENYFAGW